MWRMICTPLIWLDVDAVLPIIIICTFQRFSFMNFQSNSFYLTIWVGNVFVPTTCTTVSQAVKEWGPSAWSIIRDLTSAENWLKSGIGHGPLHQRRELVTALYKQFIQKRKCFYQSTLYLECFIITNITLISLKSNGVMRRIWRHSTQLFALMMAAGWVTRVNLSACSGCV